MLARLRIGACIREAIGSLAAPLPRTCAVVANAVQAFCSRDDVEATDHLMNTSYSIEEDDLLAALYW